MKSLLSLSILLSCGVLFSSDMASGVIPRLQQDCSASFSELLKQRDLCRAHIQYLSGPVLVAQQNDPRFAMFHRKEMEELTQKLSLIDLAIGKKEDRRLAKLYQERQPLQNSLEILGTEKASSGVVGSMIRLQQQLYRIDTKIHQLLSDRSGREQQKRVFGY